MPEAISNTSPLLYLYRINALDWLPELFSEIWIPNAVVLELGEGKQRGYDVPVLSAYAWLQIKFLIEIESLLTLQEHSYDHRI